MKSELGFKLLVRSSREVKPSEKGLKVLKDAEIICSLYKSWIALNDDELNLAGTITVGLPTGIDKTVMNNIIFSYADLYPKYHFKQSHCPAWRI